MARKLKAPASDSSLSPLPEDLKSSSITAPAKALPVKAPVNGNKRKAETTVKTSKRQKIVQEDFDGAEEEAEKPKKRARKVKVEEETVEYVPPSKYIHVTNCLAARHLTRHGTCD
jgi:AP endonuclease-1